MGHHNLYTRIDILRRLNMEPTMIGAYAGMFMVLAAFATETRGLVSSRSITYLVLMAIGEALLTVRAYVTGEWPFAVLGGIWAVFAIYSIIQPPTEQ